MSLLQADLIGSLAVDIGTFYELEMVYKSYDDGTPNDLTGSTLTGAIKRNSTDEVTILDLEEILDDQSTGFYVTDAVNGTFLFQIDELDTADIEEDCYCYDIIIEEPSGKKTVLVPGKIQFKETCSL